MEENKEEIKEVKDVKKVENSKAVAIIIIVLLIALIAGVAVWYFKMPKKQNIIANEVSANAASNNVIENKITNLVSNEIINVIENVVSNNEIEAEIVEKGKVTEEEKKSEDTKKEESKEAEKQSEMKGEEKQTKSEDTKIKETKTETKKDEPKTENKETETDKKEETNKTSEVKPAEPVKPTKTGTDSTRELTNSETKYGVKTNTYTITFYDVYSDGSKVETGKKTETEYDNSGYSATTAELLPEAKQVKSKNSGIIQEVLKYTNQYRKEANKNKENGISDRKDLVLDSNLTLAACVRAIEMGYSETFSHKRPNGSYCFTAIDDLGVRYYEAGENIAWGQASAKSATTWWKNSSGHYANMINEEFGKIGIGVAKINGRYYWVQLFTN